LSIDCDTFHAPLSSELTTSLTIISAFTPLSEISMSTSCRLSNDTRSWKPLPLFECKEVNSFVSAKPTQKLNVYGCTTAILGHKSEWSRHRMALTAAGRLSTFVGWSLLAAALNPLSWPVYKKLFI